MVRPVPALFLAFSFLLPLHVFAQRSGTIVGNVYYENEHNPARNVIVNLFNNQRGLIASTATADSGQFRFAGLSPSSFLLTIDAPGYERFSHNLDISMGADRILTICLQPLQKSQNAPPSGAISAHELSMPPKARDLLRSGTRKLYQEKNPQAALPDIQKALSLAPTYYEALYHLAVAQLTLGNSSTAESSLRKSITLSDNKYPESCIALGALLLDQGKITEADSFLRRGLQLEPNFWRVHYELGCELLSQNRPADALVFAERARLLAPSVPVVYRLHSNIHLLQKDYPALLEDLDTYITLDPDSSAGLRAKQLRNQVLRLLPPESSSDSAPPRPHSPSR